MKNFNFLKLIVPNVFIICVSIIDKSRNPDIAIFKVLGIGVALNVKTLTSFLYFLIFSLCRTPNLCSSSTTNKPSFLNLISSLNKRCVPNTKSIVPFSNPARLL